MDKYQILENVLNNLVGQSCWSVMVSEGLDNAIGLSIGEKIERILPLEAPNLTEDQQRYIGAYELNIADCTWRLDSPNTIVTSWSDDEIAKDESLMHLIDVPITAWEITWPGLDLTLHFANQLSLRLFCDQTDPLDGGDNYALLSPQYLFLVGTRSNLTLQPRPEA